MYSLGQIAEICDCGSAGDTSVDVSFFFCDSRAVMWPNQSLFIAIRTHRNNGHHYISELIDKGVRAFLIEDGQFDTSGFAGKGIGFILSQNPLQTLQNLASYHRQQFNIPVIGITGSNGKTMVKEWLYQLLKSDHSICRSPKSYNSQIGVPLSVLNLNASHSLGIFEAGISQSGEMSQLASIIRPTMAVLTSLGSAHDEGFQSQESKLTEKSLLLKGAQQVIVNGLRKDQISLANNITFLSSTHEGDVTYTLKNNQLLLTGKQMNESYAVPFTDEASVANLATCITVMKAMGYHKEVISERIAALQPLSLRLELKTGRYQSLLINDFYNSDLDSLAIALNYLIQKSSGRKKSVIVSDIEQSGIPSAQLYQRVSKLFSDSGIDLVIGIGKDISAHRELFHTTILSFQDTDQFLKAAPGILPRLSQQAILLKGARSFGFEAISTFLQQKSHDTLFEVHLNKLIDNVNYFRSNIRPGVQLMCMVKAMGYGSGSIEVAQTLQHMGVGYLAVAYADEGVELRNASISLPIMVMNPEENAFEDMINHRLEPEIYSFRVLDLFLKQLDRMGLTEPYPVHIKMDTGMHRLGFLKSEWQTLGNRLKQTSQIKIKSVFSHLAASDNPDLDRFTEQQILEFKEACAFLETQLGYAFLKHICNSGAISRFPEAHFNMVRLGIGMYGIGVNSEEQTHLQNVGALKTRISQIKTLASGDTVGYNRNGRINGETRIAVLPIGYADGFSRSMGNGKFGVYVNGQFCKTIGNICMDMCMVDVSGVDCHEGDEVILFETTQQISAMAQAMNSIPYEVLTNVSGRVKRVYLQE